MNVPLKAYEDIEFLNSDACRPIRLELEYLHPETTMQQEGIESTIVLFGSARIPSPETLEQCTNETLKKFLPFYEEARKFAHLASTSCQTKTRCECVIITGGGPGIMEAGNRGAAEAHCKSIALNITLPHEQEPNPYVTPALNFEFHYFHMRKMHFLKRAKALCVFPGGYGTFDELFEAVTLIQTGKIEPMPVILFGTKHWKRLIDWEYLAETGMIGSKDLDLITFCDAAEDAWDFINDYYAKVAVKESE